jgi:hypothetical protein
MKPNPLIRLPALPPGGTPSGSPSHPQEALDERVSPNSLGEEGGVNITNEFL